jgi:protein-tyrosine phosphatase
VTRYRICFVCSGNICRSPMAEVVLNELAAHTPLDAAGARSEAAPPAGPEHAARGRARTLAELISVRSAGTGPWHEGEPMDDRARAALQSAGYRDHGHVARQIRVEELRGEDLVVALDRRHLQTLRSLLGEPHGGRLVLLRSFVPGGALDVPDPYYGDGPEFRRCLETIEGACRGLVRHLAAVLDGRNPS